MGLTVEQAMGGAGERWIEAANGRLAGAGQVRCVPGPNAQPLLHVETSTATALIAFQGAQILSFRPAGWAPSVTAHATDDLLFVSRQARFAPGHEIMGGVPVCWPWFGRDALAARAGLHGFVRYCDWTLQQVRPLPDGRVELALTLNESGLRSAALSADMDARWPAGARLELALRIGPTLSLRLTTCNEGAQSLRLTQGLHSYCRIGTPSAITIDGVDGCQYLDKSSSGTDAPLTQTGPVRLAGEINRIYRAVPGAVCVTDHALGRRLRIRLLNSRTCVIWTPWAHGARTMAGLGADDYRDFVCIEPVNTDLEIVEIAPGASACLGAEFCLEPLEDTA